MNNLDKLVKIKAGIDVTIMINIVVFIYSLTQDYIKLAMMCLFALVLMTNLSTVFALTLKPLQQARSMLQNLGINQDD